MSEKNNYPKTHEAHATKHNKQPTSHEVKQSKHETESSKHERHEKQQKTLEQAKNNVEEHTLSTEQYKKRQESSADTHHERPHHYLTKKIKNTVFRQNMENVQTHLKPREKKFSKFIHNNTVETLSEAGSKTIARPNVIIGAGLFMAFGGLVVMLVARKYGFEVPLSVYLAFYTVGFVIAFIVDVIYGKVRSRKQTHS